MLNEFGPAEELNLDIPVAVASAKTQRARLAIAPGFIVFAASGARVAGALCRGSVVGSVVRARLSRLPCRAAPFRSAVPQGRAG